jgi:viroplasmin and RNaseH domain-containing protein
MAGKKFYAVKVGKRPGIYTSWCVCLLQLMTVQTGRGFEV